MRGLHMDILILTAILLSVGVYALFHYKDSKLSWVIFIYLLIGYSAYAFWRMSWIADYVLYIIIMILTAVWNCKEL